MEKLTINKFGEEKLKSGVSQKTGKPYSFKTIGFVSNEYPDRWYNINYNNQNPLALGKSHELEIKSREYNGKTYYDAALPKSVAAPNAATMYISRNVDATLAGVQVLTSELRQLVKRLEMKGVLDDISNEPLNTRNIAPKIEYPPSNGPTAFDQTDEEPPIEAYDQN